MKKLLIIFAVSLIILSCDKEKGNVSVTYKVSNALSEMEILFSDGNQNIQTVNTEFESLADKWEYSFEANKGDIVYISAIYQDSSSSVSVQIITDGKVYKQGSSKNEPGKYITVSGTVPY